MMEMVIGCCNIESQWVSSTWWNHGLVHPMMGNQIGCHYGGTSCGPLKCRSCGEVEGESDCLAVS